MKSWKRLAETLKFVTNSQKEVLLWNNSKQVELRCKNGQNGTRKRRNRRKIKLIKTRITKKSKRKTMKRVVRRAVQNLKWRKDLMPMRIKERDSIRILICILRICGISMTMIPNAIYTVTGMGPGQIATLMTTRTWKTCLNWRRLKLRRRNEESRNGNSGDSSALRGMVKIIKAKANMTKTTMMAPWQTPTTLCLTTLQIHWMQLATSINLKIALQPSKDWSNREKRKKQAKWKQKSQMNSSTKY